MYSILISELRLARGALTTAKNMYVIIKYASTWLTFKGYLKLMQLRKGCISLDHFNANHSTAHVQVYKKRK